MSRSVWITGMGAVSPGGWSADETWNTVVAGKPCIKSLVRFPTFNAGTHIGGSVPGRESTLPDDWPLSLEFGMVAAAEAAAQAGLTDHDGVDVAVVAYHGERRLPTPDSGDALLGPIDVVAKRIGQSVGAARSTALYGACAGGVLAIGAALKLIQSGSVEVALAGGTDSLLRPIDFFQFCSLYAMSSRDCRPEEASCPFDLRRDGFVLSEGAGFIVLEEESHARRRGAEPLALVEGFGSAQNAYHIVASPPDAQGPARAMAAALLDAGLPPEAIGYINAHGTSTRDNDWCETLAIRMAFGPHAERLPVSSSKSELGHSMAAAGAIETIISVMAMREGVAPPTINLKDPDPRCDLDYVPGEARELQLEHVVNNSFGFGGHSASLVLGRPQ